MPSVPLVSEDHWERVARDFDDIGPEACVGQIVAELRTDNPHYLAIARRCARDAVDEAGTFAGFAKFYRILALCARDRGEPVPRIAPQTLDVVDTLVAEFGEDRFVALAAETLCEENACLAAMAHGFASRSSDYLMVMQGFAVLYNCISVQATISGLSPRSGAERR